MLSPVPGAQVDVLTTGTQLYEQRSNNKSGPVLIKFPAIVSSEGAAMIDPSPMHRLLDPQPLPSYLGQLTTPAQHQPPARTKAWAVVHRLSIGLLNPLANTMDSGPARRTQMVLAPRNNSGVSTPVSTGSQHPSRPSSRLSSLQPSSCTLSVTERRTTPPSLALRTQLTSEFSDRGRQAHSTSHQHLPLDGLSVATRLPLLVPGPRRGGVVPHHPRTSPPPWTQSPSSSAPCLPPRIAALHGEVEKLADSLRLMIETIHTDPMGLCPLWRQGLSSSTVSNLSSRGPPKPSKPSALTRGKKSSAPAAPGPDSAMQDVEMGEASQKLPNPAPSGQKPPAVRPGAHVAPWPQPKAPAVPFQRSIPAGPPPPTPEMPALPSASPLPLQLLRKLRLLRRWQGSWSLLGPRPMSRLMTSSGCNAIAQGNSLLDFWEEEEEEPFTYHSGTLAQAGPGGIQAGQESLATQSHTTRSKLTTSEDISISNLRIKPEDIARAFEASPLRSDLVLAGPPRVSQELEEQHSL
ncbi:hypothetical protein DFP72DRAFT_850720 [Ephemerocybe angulata]|uniref:Uncharacterized protein n=1 Tax=Ephemerocybe angulata TaxID=980116 RepID=A0A8H6HRY5_9AGAR|nr:hypothetical protein DFP72DRAFT_850720 [Tulosesus angulatus]